MSGCFTIILGKPIVQQLIPVIDIRVSMVIFIKSRATSFLQRKIARWTWAGFEFIDGLRLEAIFILGNAKENIQSRIQSENETYGDILQVEIADNYS